MVTSTPNLFRVLDVTPFVGRLIADENALSDGERVVVLSYGLWQTRFAGDKAVVGKIIQMNGRPATVIGVMRPDFAFPSSDVAAYMALRATPSYVATLERWSERARAYASRCRRRDGTAGPGRCVAPARAEYPVDNKDLRPR